MARRIKQQPLLWLVIAVVFVGSLVSLFVRQPERVVAISADRVMRIEGLARQSGQVSVSYIAPQEYGLLIDQNGVLEDLVIFVTADAFIQGARLSYFNRATNAWQEELLRYDDRRREYFVQIERLGSTSIRIMIPVVNSVDNGSLL